MGEYSYCGEIREKYAINDLDSKTLTYRIDGFIKACNMNLEDCYFTKEISSFRMPYINIHNDNAGLNYDVNFAYNYDHDMGKNYSLFGKYNE